MPQPIRELGSAPFAREAMKERLPEFRRLLAERPIGDNHGGMRAPHLFATWFMLQTLRPTHIVESGVFKGLGTWMLEQAAPAARLYCIEPNPGSIVYRSARAEYFTRDFSELSWELPRESTLLFFDDHQDALSRVELCSQSGFVHLIFEDNYPAGRGDCYSLKKALMGEPVPTPKGLAKRALRALAGPTLVEQDPARYLEGALATYFEFPPVHRAKTTRWGDEWAEEAYPTPATLLDGEPDPSDPFLTDARDYTWICYAQLKPALPRAP